MHSTIYQISNSPIDKADYLKPELITPGEFVTIDYVGEPYTMDGQRANQILHFLNVTMPTGMFSLNHDYSLTFQGKFDEWKKSYYENVKEWCDLMTPDNMLAYIGPAFQVMKTINNPLNSDRLLVTDTYDRMGTAEKSGEFFRTFIRKLKPGDKIYFGAIYDYHA